MKKNFRHWSRWAKKQGLTAYRIYDRDIPEYPYAVDWYAGRVHVMEFPSRRMLREQALDKAREQAVVDIAEALGVEPSLIYTKTHSPMPWGRAQYERLGRKDERFIVEEQGLRFWVNLIDYLDTGLFLDHRLTRARIRAEARGKRFLNLFAYTGSFTVYAAAGGAKSTTSVDLSKTYLDWARDNLKLNDLDGPRHQLIRADVLSWIEDASTRSERYDLVVLDPPSFSASKKMSRSFDVQRDHPSLIRDTMRLLASGGQLYFSANYGGFELDQDLKHAMTTEEITSHSLPEDFHRQLPHRCWRVSER